MSRRNDPTTCLHPKSNGLALLLGCLVSLACNKGSGRPSSGFAGGGTTGHASEGAEGGTRVLGDTSEGGAGAIGTNAGTTAGRTSVVAATARADGGSSGRAAGTGGAAPRGAAGGSATGSGGGSAMGGGGGTQPAGTALFFDDFLGSSIDSTKWTIFDRISDQSNGEINCCVPANVSVSGGFLTGVSKHEDHSCGDSQQAPVSESYTSWQIQQKTGPFLYGTVQVRAKPPGGTGIWPVIWMLGNKWQASQPATANIPDHNWPHDGWCEIDIAEFWQNARSQVNTTVHFNSPGGLHQQALPFDATSRYMVYRLQWSQNSLVWSVDAEDGAGFRPLYTVTGAGNVPNVPMYVVINAAIGGSGGGTPDPATFPQTFSVDWVSITQ